MRAGSWICGVLAALLALAPMLAPPVAYAQSPVEFYKGRNVDLYIGYSAGGAYDLYARVLARHLGNLERADNALHGIENRVGP